MIGQSKVTGAMLNVRVTGRLRLFVGRRLLHFSFPPLPRSMSKLLLRSIAAIAVLAIAAAGYVGWRQYSARRAWQALRPPTPAPLGTSAPGADARIAACAARLDGWPPDHAALAEFTRLCHANGRLDEAMAGYQALIVLEPNDPHWPHLLATILSGFGRLDEALPLMRRTTALDPSYLVAWLKLGDALLKSNALPDAQAAYQEALQRDPGNAYALVGLARCDLQSGRLTAARSRLEQSVRANGDAACAESLLAEVFDRLGNPEAAAYARSRVANSGHYTEPPDTWLEALNADCYDPYALLTAASTAMSDGLPKKALPLLERAIGLAPNDARLHRQLAKTLTALHEPARARQEAERAVALDPGNDAIQLDLIALLRQTGDEPAADRAIMAGLQACPNSTALHVEAGVLAANAGRLDEARRDLEFAWQSRPDQAGPALELAKVYFATGRDPDGFALLEDVLKRFPTEKAALVMLIRRGIEKGDPRTAGWLQRAASLNPPKELLAELTADYRRRFGPTQ